MCSTLLVTPSCNWYSSAVTCVGEAFCACAAYNFVVLYDHTCTSAKAILRAHSNKVTAIAAAKGDDEEVVLSGGRDKTLIAWSVRRQCVLRKQKKLPAEVTALVVCPHDANIAMVALGTGAVTLWKWKKGGHEQRPSALSSAASVLRSMPTRAVHQGVVLAGCEDGTIVGLDSATVSALWKVDITAACNIRKSPVFNSSKGPGDPKVKNAKKGVQDISVTAVSTPSVEADRAKKSSECIDLPQLGGQAVLLAVTTRSCQLAVFAWPSQGPEHTTGTSSHVTTPTNACQSVQPTEGDAAEPCCVSVCKPVQVSRPFLHKPTFLEKLSVPSPTSEVSWLPICWLPGPPPSSQVLEQVECTVAHIPYTDPREEGSSEQHHQQPSSESIEHPTSETALQPTDSKAPSSRVQCQAEQAVDARNLLAWLLVGLPSGRMCLWSVKINVESLHELTAHSSHSSRVPEGRSSNAPANRSWRIGTSGGGPGTQGSGGEWRKAGAIEARSIKLNADDVHIRMLFTVHAIPGSALDSAAPRTWQVITTSYDRKTVSWGLNITADGNAAQMKTSHIWTGTGADVLAMCTSQVQARQQRSCVSGTEVLFVSTGEKHLRRFTCQHAKASDSLGADKAHSELQQPQCAVLTLSGSADLFYQGIASELTALCCVESLVVAGCRDGSVGLIDTKLPTLKAKFAKFSLRHDGPVLSCIAWKSTNLQHTTGADGQDADLSVAVEIFTLGADGKVLQWRGLSELTELHSLLRSNMGAEKIASLPKPVSLASSLPESIQKICTFSSMELVQSYLLLGGGHGHVMVVEVPEPGEHSLNTALQAPSFEFIGSALVNTAAVTAVTGVPLTRSNTRCGQENGQGKPLRMLVVAASALGSVAVFSLDLQAESAVRALICVAMLTDVSSAVTSLQLTPHPSTLDHVINGGTSATDQVKPAAVHNGSTAVEHTKAPEWVLCACAASDNVHLWTISPHARSEFADSAVQAVNTSDSEQFAMYCGALKGVGHSATPVCMRIVGHRLSPTQHQDGEEPSRVQLPPSAPLWLVVACTDRSVRAWRVTSKLLDMHRISKLPVIQSAATEVVEQTHAPSQSVESTAAAVALPVLQYTLHDAHPAKLMEVGTVHEMARDAQQPCSSIDCPHASSEPQQNPEKQPDDLILSLDQQQGEHPGTPEQLALPGAAHNDKEGPVTSESYSLQHAHITTPEGAAETSPVSVAPQLLQDTGSKACAPTTATNASAHTLQERASSAQVQASQGGSNSQAGAGSNRGSAQESMASKLSRFVGVSKSAEVSRLRPRAYVLGAQSMMQSFVDNRLSSTESSGLPGAARSSVDADEVLTDLIAFHESEEQAERGAGKASKAAAGVRNAAAASAQRIALLYLWQGDVCRALDTVIEADALNADFVAMAMGAGPEVWRAVVALYAAQLAACGEIHLAVGYLCSAGDFEQAVTVYKNSGLMLEALMLAERHLPPTNPMLGTLRDSLQTQLAHGSASEPPAALAAWGVDVMIANGDVQGAVRKLVGKDGVCSDKPVARACELLMSEGHHVVAAELSSRAALGSSNPLMQKHWLQAALSQDVGVACAAVAIGIVQELLDSLLDYLVSLAVVQGSVVLSEVDEAASRCCSRFASNLQRNLPSSSNASARSLPMGFLQIALERAVGAINGAVPRSEVPLQGKETGVSTDIDAVGQADTAALPELLQQMAQSVLGCVTAALCCIDSKGLLPAHLEDLASSVPRLVPALVLTTADGQAAERLSIDIAACCVAASLGVTPESQGSLLLQSGGNDCMQPSVAALDGWELYAASKCSARYIDTSEYDEDSSDADCVLQPSVWQSTVLELQRALELDARAVAEPGNGSVAKKAVVNDQAVVPEKPAVPVVSVLDSALQELSDLPVGMSDDDGTLQSPYQSPYHTPDSTIACIEPGATPIPDRRRKGRAGEGSSRSAAKADDLHWSDVEAYQRTVQAFTPQDWAAFRKEAQKGGHAVTVFATAADDAAAALQVQAAVVRSGVVELEQGEEPSEPEQRPRAAAAAGDAYVDAVVEGWRGVLKLHPGRVVTLT